MKKVVKLGIIAIFSLFFLFSCSPEHKGTLDATVIYSICSAISLVLLICCCIVRVRRQLFIVLFSSVLTINLGYTLLSASNTLQLALMANRLAYLGSVMLMPTMLLIISDLCTYKLNKKYKTALFLVAFIMFIITASVGILPIYYKEVSLESVGVLNKVYGPLHPLYLLYLLSHFTAMVIMIIRSYAKRTLELPSHAAVLVISVLVNLCVWFAEQLISVNFELLSISYIISELFLLGLSLVMSENRRLKEEISHTKDVITVLPSNNTEDETPITHPVDDTPKPELIEMFTSGVKLLTPAEKSIYNAHVSRATSRKIMAMLNITENTLKYHNKNIYSKLGVSSKKELLEIYKHIIIAEEK